MTETRKYPVGLYEGTFELVNRSIMIAGPARSGTRILGSLFQSLKEVEYTFEPPMLYCLIPTIEDMPEAQWKYLFESYLVEEFLFNAMAGRFLNFNPHDYSYVLKSKSQAEIDARLGRTYSRIEVQNEAHKRRIVAKIPDLTPWLSTIADYYPAITSIIMLRKPESVIGSFSRKQWFSDDTLKGPLNYPPYRKVGEYYLSYLVAEEDAESYIQMSLVERNAYYFIRAYENIPHNGNVIIIDYDDFVVRPKEIFANLTAHLGLSPGDMTQSVLAMVREPEKDRTFSWDGVDAELKAKVFTVAEDLGRRVTSL